MLNIETKPEMTVLSYCTKTNFASIAAHTAVSQELFADAIAQGAAICGPVYWKYINCTGKAEDEFELEILLPIAIAPNTYSGRFALKTEAAFRCASETHRGAWNEVGALYCRVMGELAAQGLQPSNIQREMYVHCDFSAPANCITEVQIGIFEPKL